MLHYLIIFGAIMTRENIKKAFLEVDNKYPFKSTEIFNVLGYSKHSNFIRAVHRANKQNYPLYITFSKLNERRTKAITISRELFLILANKHNEKKIYFSFYSEYLKHYYKNVIWIWGSYRTLTYPKFVYVYTKVKGKFYAYSLNTYNVANAIDIDPFKLFEFTSKNFHSQFNNFRVDFINKYTHSSPAIPIMHFDSLSYETRWEFILLLKKIGDEYSLTEIQKEKLKIYKEIIVELLHQQYKYDYEKKNNAVKNKKLSAPKTKEIKLIYKKAAKLCHPDISKSNSELFKSLNNAYNNNDYLKVKDIYEQLIN